MATNPLLDDPALNQAAKAIKSGNPLLSDPALDAAVAAAKAGAEKKAPAQTAGRLGGMTARNLIEGAAGAVGAITDPFVMAIGGAVRAATGNDYDPVTMNKIGQSVADALGLPQAETGAERVSSALQKGLLSGGGFAGLAGQVAGRTSGATQAAATALAAQPALQAVAGAGAGAGGQLAAEAGAGPGAQIAASLAGGLGAAGASGALQRAARVPGAVVDPAQQAILDAGTANNVPVLTSDVLPPNSFMSKSLQSMGERIPVAGTGPVRATQQAAREGSVANIAAQYGKPDYEAIVGSVKGRIGGIKKAAGRVINQAGAELDTYGTAVPIKTIRTIDDAIADLSRPEVYKPGYQGYIDDLTELKNSFTPQTTYSNLRETRTALRESMDSVDPFKRSQMPSKTKALYAKAYSALKNDMDDFAALNLPPDRVAKLNRANVVYGETAGLLKNTRLKNILDKGDVTPEVVKGIVFNGQPSEMKTLYDALGPIGRQNVRAAVIDDAVTKSVLANGEINPNRFGAELAKKEKNVSAFFRGDDRDAVRGLTRLLQVTRRGQDASLAPTNGSSAIPYALGAGAIADLGITLSTAAASGGLARVYESAPVRNLLLKLANVPRNTAQEGELVRKLAVAIRTEQQRQENSQQATPQQ